MKLRSLQSRLDFGLGVSLLVLIVCVWLVGYETLQRVGQSFILAGLQHDAEALVAALKEDPDGRPLHLGQRRLTPVYRQPYSGHYYVLALDGGETHYSRSLWDRTLEMPSLAPGESTHWRTLGPAEQELLVWGGGFRKQGQAFTLAVAEDISLFADDLSRFQWILSALAGGGVLLLFLVQRGLINQAFRKLEPVYRDIERLERGDAVSLSEDLPIEVLPLVRKLNHLLEQYRQRLERSRNATGNLAHALKTPLNLLVQQLNQAEPPLEPAHLKRLNDQVDRIHQLMERELKRARFAGSVGPGRQFHPAEELPTLARLMESMHPDKQLRVACRIDADGPVPADREDMLELVGNLLDNACKWAASRVRCQIQRDADQWWLRVEDDGPGCDEQALQRIAERGTRLDESVDGHGIGLSVVQEILRLYNGRIEYGRSATLGGFSARVTMGLWGHAE
jgi:signal transduction histidine kinase